MGSLFIVIPRGGDQRATPMRLGITSMMQPLTPDLAGKPTLKEPDTAGAMKTVSSVYTCIKLLLSYLGQYPRKNVVGRGQIIGPTLQPTDLSTERRVFGPIYVS